MLMGEIIGALLIHPSLLVLALIAILAIVVWVCDRWLVAPLVPVVRSYEYIPRDVVQRQLVVDYLALEGARKQGRAEREAGI